MNRQRKEDEIMRIYRAQSYQDLSRKTANIISAQVIMKPDAILGLATGSSPIGAYEQLIEWYQKGDLDFSQIRTVNLDEYKSLGPENEQSYSFFMRQNLFDHINIPLTNTFIPNGLETDVAFECKRYNDIIHSLGGIDLQLLGIGSNGHIGFNEPGASFEKETHCVSLTKETMMANSRFFDSIEQVPTHAYSTGIKNIMQSRHILLIASGKSKAQALYQSLYGPITPSVPGSILQLHNHVTVVADSDALEVIIQKGFCREDSYDH